MKRKTSEARPARQLWTPSEAARPWWILAWALVAQISFLVAGDVVNARPTSQFFLGDTLLYLAKAHAIAEGGMVDGGLPFRPPLVAWATVPLWWLWSSAASVLLAGKCVMVLLNAVTYALFYRWIRHRLSLAFPICLWLPLGFNELLLASAVSNEVVYRLILVLLLALGWRWPLLAGALHGLAALTRAEHLPFALLLAVLALWKLPARRRWVGVAALGLLLIVGPYTVSSAAAIRQYNEAHAGQLGEPLPEWVPISFYGPLNFALAQREAGIHFSRRTLPPAPAGMAGLDPRFAPHNEAIQHGYAMGFRKIFEEPGRFLQRSVEKTFYSLGVAGFGWAWADFPKAGPWQRQPVDLASRGGGLYTLLCWGFIAAGAWSLRGRKTFLWVGVSLLLYRLSVNVAFFPYLRGMMIVSPFLVALFFTGLGRIFGKKAERNLLALWLIVAIFHLASMWIPGKYAVRGERLPDGTLLDDRPLWIEYEGRR